MTLTIRTIKLLAPRDLQLSGSGIESTGSAGRPGSAGRDVFSRGIGRNDWVVMQESLNEQGLFCPIPITEEKTGGFGKEEIRRYLGLGKFYLKEEDIISTRGHD